MIKIVNKTVFAVQSCQANRVGVEQREGGMEKVTVAITRGTNKML